MRLVAAIAFAALCTAGAQAQTSFMFGMLFGQAISTRVEALNAAARMGVPLRCLAANTRDQYVACRFVSLINELHSLHSGAQVCLWSFDRKTERRSMKAYAGAPAGACDVDMHIDLEIAAIAATLKAGQ